MMTAKSSEPVPSFSFSTLACPDWSPRQVVNRAAALGYDAIEWRGGDDGHVSIGWTASDRALLGKLMADAGVRALAVTAYSTFSSPDPARRAQQEQDLASHLELAADLGAPFVRTFLADPADGTPIAVAARRAIESLERLAPRAAALGVAIAIEPHDDLVRAADVASVLRAIAHPAVGAIWDPVNSWKVGEDPEEGAIRLAPWLRYIQLKDARRLDSRWALCRIGEGEVPLLRGLGRLAAVRQLPPLSLEWERAWHPELEPAEVVLEPALAALRRLAADALGTALQLAPEGTDLPTGRVAG